MGGHVSKKDRFIKGITSKDRDLMYDAYDKQKIVESFSEAEVEQNLLIQRLTNNLTQPEFRRLTINILQKLSERHYGEIIKYVIPKLMTLDIFQRSVTRNLFSNADFVEDILVLINVILLKHSKTFTQNQGIILLGFLKNFIIMPFPKFHFRRTQILSRVYVGLQCLAATAFPFSQLQKYAWKTLDILLRAMNLLLIETVIFIQKGRFESLVLEYRGQKICEVKGDLACNSLFKLSRLIIHQIYSENRSKKLHELSITLSKRERKKLLEEEESDDEEELYPKFPPEVITDFPLEKNTALIDWAVRSVIRIFENTTISKLLFNVGWIECLVEIILFSEKKEFVVLGMERILQLLKENKNNQIRIEEDKSTGKKKKKRNSDLLEQNKLEYYIRKLFEKKGKKNLDLIIESYYEYIAIKTKKTELLQTLSVATLNILEEEEDEESEGEGDEVINDAQKLLRLRRKRKREVRKELKSVEDKLMKLVGDCEILRDFKTLLFRNVLFCQKRNEVKKWGFSDAIVVCHEY